MGDRLALPGDAIVIYADLVQQAKSQNELMMVLGHELGHFAHRDHWRGLGGAYLSYRAPLPSYSVMLGRYSE
ncbi:M48 family metalloprotease [Microcoleus sp. ZQ-A2]